jgi:LmbE family N-acetylglucosaminyl deacetylase
LADNDGKIMDLHNAAIVVAHPDDEVLWFSALTPKVAKIVMCYGSNPRVIERGKQRKRVIEDYPLDTVQFLDLPEPDLWQGRELGSVEQELARFDREDMSLRRALAAQLSQALQGMSTVFVHNPWGEYGHDDHRRVYAVVNMLHEYMGFAVYISNYVSRRALALMSAMLSVKVADVVEFGVEYDVVSSIVELYKTNSCWTWTEDWRWPKQDCFFALSCSTRYRSITVPIVLFDV